MYKNKTMNFIKEYKSLVILFIIVIIAAIGTNGKTLTLANFQNLMLQVAIQGIVGFGMTYCLLAGEFDLSVGSVLTLSGIIFAQCLGVMGLVPAILITLALSALLGLINGILVAKMGLSSFIGTMGTMYAYKGIAQIISQGKPTAVSNPIIIAISKMRIGGFAIFPFIFILVGLICAYVLMKTRFGRNIYATGGNYEVAKNSGIKVDFYKIMSFAIVCLSAGFAGILLTTRLQSATPIAGEDLNLLVVSSVIIGGTSPAGGVGSIQKSFIGLMIIGVVTNSLDLMNISGYYQQVVQGFLTVGVIGAASYANYRNVSSL